MNKLFKVVSRFGVITAAFALLPGCASMEFHAFGLNITEMHQTAQAKDYGQIILGATASIATHIAGHFLAAELCNVNIDLIGLTEVVDYSTAPSPNDLRWVARGGFLLQLAVNTVLVEFANDAYFTKGYTAFTSIEILTYPFRHPDDGDLNFLDEQGGNGVLEYVLFNAWGTYNFLRISLETEVKGWNF